MAHGVGVVPARRCAVAPVRRRPARDACGADRRVGDRWPRGSACSALAVAWPSSAAAAAAAAARGTRPPPAALRLRLAPLPPPPPPPPPPPLHLPLVGKRMRAASCVLTRREKEGGCHARARSTRLSQRTRAAAFAPCARAATMSGGMETVGVVANALPIEKDLEATLIETYAARDGVPLPPPANTKDRNEFRDYKKEARPSVKRFYGACARARCIAAAPQRRVPQLTRLRRDLFPTTLPTPEENHTKQTLEFVLAKKKEFLTLNRRKMGIWEAMEYLNQLVDDSDPDTSLTQIEVRAQDAGGRARGPRGLGRPPSALRLPALPPAPAADRRGDPPRRPPALVHPDGPDPRPWQDPLPVGRAAVGRRRRHQPRCVPCTEGSGTGERTRIRC